MSSAGFPLGIFFLAPLYLTSTVIFQIGFLKEANMKNNSAQHFSHLKISIATFLFLGPLAPVAMARGNPDLYN